MANTNTICGCPCSFKTRSSAIDERPARLCINWNVGLLFYNANR